MTEDMKQTRDWTDLLKEAAQILEFNARLLEFNQAEAEDLVKEIRAYIEARSDVGEWWCHTCKVIVSPAHVTWSEHHDQCGTFLGKAPLY